MEKLKSLRNQLGYAVEPVGILVVALLVVIIAYLLFRR